MLLHHARDRMRWQVGDREGRAAKARKRAEDQDGASCAGRRDVHGPTERTLSLFYCHGHPDSGREAQLFHDDALNALRSLQVHRTIINAIQQDVSVPRGAPHFFSVL